MSVLEDVKAVIAEQLSVELAGLKEGDDFVKDLGADSLDVVELIMAFEEKFGINIPDDKAEKMSTIKDVVNFIELEKSKTSK